MEKDELRFQKFYALLTEWRVDIVTHLAKYISDNLSLPIASAEETPHHETNIEDEDDIITLSVYTEDVKLRTIERITSSNTTRQGLNIFKKFSQLFDFTTFSVYFEIRSRLLWNSISIEIFCTQYLNKIKRDSQRKVIEEFLHFSDFVSEQTLQEDLQRIEHNLLVYINQHVNNPVRRGY